MLKRILRSQAAGRTASAAIGAYIRLVDATSHWEIEGAEHIDAALAQGRGAILAFWHARLLMAPTVRKRTKARVYMLSSAHRDGDIIANAVRSFGIDFIRGSAADPNKPGKNKSGASAIAQMIAALSENAIIGFTPDGPRGPAEVVKPGLVRLAALSGAPVIPAAYSASRGRRMDSWDRFFLAAPFSRGYYIAGAPIAAPSGDDAVSLEEARARVEDALRAVTHEADRRAGRSDGTRGRPAIA